MSQNQTPPISKKEKRYLAAAGTLVATGEAVANWIAEHSEFLIAVAIAAFFLLVYSSIVGANNSRDNG